jgi:carboxymethylenebutenolidase
MKFKNNKISHEHIYWDQASVMVQIGLLNPEGLPVTGVQQTNKFAELSKN